MMLWSLIKILSFVALVTITTFGAEMLLEAQGGVIIEYSGFELSFAPLQAVILVLVLIVIFWILTKVIGVLFALLRFINGDETALSRYFDRNRERRGFEALSGGLIALASGNGKDAMVKAKKADRLLNRPDLTNLVVAQAAVAGGDEATAKETFKKLLKDPKTRFVGVYGLLQQNLQAGETGIALKLAEHAFALKPKHIDTQDALLKLQAREEDWQGVRTTLEAKLKHGALPRDLYKRRDGVFALSQAREAWAAGKIQEAQKLAIEANRLSPALVPAALLAALGYTAQGKIKLASRTLRAAWLLEPHPELAAGFAEIVPDESPKERLKRFMIIIESKPKHPETKMLLAELNIATSNYKAARLALGDLSIYDPTMRSLTIMAAIERGDGADDQSVRQLLTQAISAQRDPQWICDSCGNIHQNWEPLCLNCEAIDSIGWKRPPQSEAVSPQILPLIVGHLSPLKKSNPIVVPEAEIEVLDYLGQTDAEKKT